MWQAHVPLKFGVETLSLLEGLPINQTKAGAEAMSKNFFELPEEEKLRFTSCFGSKTDRSVSFLVSHMDFNLFGKTFFLVTLFGPSTRSEVRISLVNTWFSTGLDRALALHLPGKPIDCSLKRSPLIFFGVRFKGKRLRNGTRG